MRHNANPHRFKLFQAIALAGLIGLATACSSSPAEEPNSSGEPGGSGLEVSEVRISGIKAPGTVPLEYAADEIAPGYGLTIEPVYVDNSGVAVSSVIGGDVVATNASFFGVIDAINQGLELVVIAEGWASTPNTGTLEALETSGITSLEDLAGKTVNVISLNSSHAIKLRSTMLEQGLDPDAVNWVELPYGEVAAALEQGTIDASSAVGPTLAMVRALGSVTVFDYGDGEYRGMAESGWVASSDFVENNPETVRAIQCSLLEAQRDIVDDRSIYESYLQSFLGAPAEAAAEDVMVEFQSENRFDEIQRNSDIYLSSGRLAEAFDFTDYVLPTPDCAEVAVD